MLSVQSEREGSYNYVSKSYRMALWKFVIAFTLLGYLSILYKTYFIRPTVSTIKGDVDSINKYTNGRIEMFYHYKINNSIYHSIHIAHRDTLNADLNDTGVYNIQYEIKNPEKTILIIKKIMYCDL